MKDLTSEQFGSLFVVAFAGWDRNRHILWRVKCVCGEFKTVQGHRLKSGRIKSCGCQRTIGRIQHGHARKRLTSPTYYVWMEMKMRCRNPKSKDYKNYGGRGITVCDRWQKFENFLADMGEAPIGLTLERINNSENYEPANCKWATRSEQARNKRPRTPPRACLTL